MTPCGVCHYCGDYCGRDSNFCSKGCSDAYNVDDADDVEWRRRHVREDRDDSRGEW